MRTFRYSLVGMVLLCLVLIVGCAPRAVESSPAAADAEGVVIDLPAIVLAVGEEGSLSASDVGVTTLNPLINLAVADATLPSNIVEGAITAGVEYIQIDNTSSGPVILVDGEPIINPIWNQEILGSTLGALDGLGVELPEGVGSLLPVIAEAGLGVILQFPAAAGDTSLPAVSTENLLTEVPDRSSISTGLNIDIQYAEDGTWTGSVPTFPPLPWDQFLTLPADTVQSATDAGVESFQLIANADGAFLALNGQDLPYIDWSGGRLISTLQLLSNMGLLGDQVAGMLPTIQNFAPTLLNFGINITLNFPT